MSMRALLTMPEALGFEPIAEKLCDRRPAYVKPMGPKPRLRYHMIPSSNRINRWAWAIEVPEDGRAIFRYIKVAL